LCGSGHAADDGSRAGNQQIGREIEIALNTMSYLVLARKYRPQIFEEVVAQEHVTRTLTNAIAAGRVAHAILFAGPRGTGKTTVARILAKAMNCKDGPSATPCNRCRSCQEITSGSASDVFEIDGASNNSVDQVRDLRDNIKYMPAHSRYKLYIIDEVHMLSTPAFNALLKTLEEPPSHVMFMFATTEPHKIPVTILSRCQRHDFRRISLQALMAQMATICDREGFRVDSTSLEVMAREAGGSMRDALSLLDQVMACATEEISRQQVLDILGVVDWKVVSDLAEAILQGDLAAGFEIVDEVYRRGHEIKTFYSNVLAYFRNLLIAAMGKPMERLLDLPAHELQQMTKQAAHVSEFQLQQVLDLLFKEEASIRFATQPKLALEVAMIRLLQAKPVLSIDALIAKLDEVRQQLGAGCAEDVTGEKRAHVENLQQSTPRPQPESKKLEAAGQTSEDSPPINEPERFRQQVVDALSETHPALAAMLQKCEVKSDGPENGRIEITGSEFAVNMVQRDKNMSLLNQVCSQLFGKPAEIVTATCVEAADDSQKARNQDYLLKQKAISHPLVADAVEIFNGRVVDVKILP
jgi:DNA polymerase-3 subunit gamma/tau